jgi:RNA polymerase sigma-70 factor (ECF subfamily)
MAALLERTELTEWDALDGCRRGDPEAFRELFEQHKDKVYSVAYRFTGDPSAAEDIAQETFVKLFDCIGSYRGGAKFESWLYRLVVNTCFDRRRRSKRFLPMLENFLGSVRAPGLDALDEVMRAEMAGHLRAAVGGLPPDQRMVVVLRYTEGLSYEQIGEILGCPKGTIASRLNRVHKSLERRLVALAGNGLAGNGLSGKVSGGQRRSA